MEPIPLQKRLLYHAGLILIGFVSLTLTFLFLYYYYFPSYGNIINGIILTALFLIPNYIFGLFFLRKVKWLFKLTVPPVIAAVSFGGFLLVGLSGFYNTCVYTVVFVLLFLYVILWEIAYQILKTVRKKKQELREQL
ncbi:MAG: hypothetical protein FWH36_04600 [Lentimicrobiaceae bacterium]|nr:hypothetical protein [Lentimicrobiaceae bacterium]